ncbi:hypothetical protein CYY_001962 [Polysphondylium violaceum]|uniref:Uncharacterized protein n=1 Tax=Polysphondylium violaceum TaxID=133409 RepID=A0A8J4Q038_9MYCE|nr:hypothetical protein CYY_001962 [Polysphondylium violaceum]
MKTKPISIFQNILNNVSQEVKHKYLFIKIFQHLFNQNERVDLKAIEITLLKLILVSKSFTREVLYLLDYPVVEIHSKKSFRLAFYFIDRWNLRLRLSLVSVHDPLAPNFILNKIQSVFGNSKKEEAMYSRLAPFIHSWQSVDNQTLKCTKPMLNIKEIKLCYNDPNPEIKNNPLVASIVKHGVSVEERVSLKCIIQESLERYNGNGDSFLPPPELYCFITALSIHTTCNPTTYKFISELRNLVSLTIDDIYVPLGSFGESDFPELLTYNDLFLYINNHPTLESLSCTYHRMKKSIEAHQAHQGTIFPKLVNLTHLTLYIDSATPDLLFINDMAKLKYLELNLSKVVPESAYVEQNRPNNMTVFNNSSLQTLILNTLSKKISWEVDSNLKVLHCLGFPLEPSKQHPALRDLSVQSIFSQDQNTQIKAFIREIKPMCHLVSLSVDLGQCQGKNPIKRLVELFNVLPSTGVRTFKFVLQNNTFKITPTLQDSLVSSIVKNKKQLDHLFLFDGKSTFIKGNKKVLFTVLSSLELISFSCWETLEFTESELNEIARLLKRPNQNLEMLSFINAPQLSDFSRSRGLFIDMPRSINLALFK